MACSSQVMEWNAYMQAVVRHLSKEFIKPFTVLDHFRDILTKEEIEKVHRETYNKGNIVGATCLLDALFQKNDWLNLLLDILQRGDVKLQHIARLIERECLFFQCHQPSKQSAQNDFSRNYPQSPSSIYIEYNSIMERSIRNLFLTCVMPCIMLYVFHKHSHIVLTKIDIENINAEIASNGEHCGARLLLERLILYEDWFNVLMQVLRNPSIKLDHVADSMEQATYSTREWYKNEKIKTEKIYSREQQNITKSANMVCDMVQEQLLASLSVTKRDGQPPKQLKYCGKTELISTALSGNADLLVTLIETSDIDETDGKGRTALMHAASKGNSESVQLLIDRNCDVNTSTPEGQTALMFAAIFGKLDCVRSLLQAKCDVNICDSNKQTALIFAAENGHNDIIEELLNAGADIDKQDVNGNSAIMYAILQKHFECVRLLVRKHASIMLLNTQGYTPWRAAREKKISLDNTR